MLKFITEEYLREKYKNKPFDSFIIENNEKLTPGGKEYLLDKKIKIENSEEKNKKFDKSINKSHLYKIKSINMEIYSLICEFLKKDIKVANELLEISKILKNIINTLEGKEQLMKISNEINNIQDIELVESYLYYANGKYIFLIKRISYELLSIQELFLNNDGIIKNFIYIENKLENIIFKITEEL